MIKKIIISALLFVTAIGFSQKSPSSGNTKAGKGNIKMADNFYSCWTSSYEENDQKTNVLIYRPCKFKEWKASMFRHYVSFNKDGTCAYLQASPNDAHFEALGTWAYTKKGGDITILNEKKDMVFKFKLVKIEKDLMKITTEAR